MGGFGSGRQSSWSGRRTTESQQRIDIRLLKKQGNLRPGIKGFLSWLRGEKQTDIISFQMELDQMVLRYRYRSHGRDWENVKQTIIFDRTPCNYGGYRLWFLCPLCCKRVAILYGAGKYFFCRHCHDLTYSSQKETKIDRLLRKERKIRRRLGASNNPIEPILFKPKNMHQKTFDRLRMEAVHTSNLSLLLRRQQLDKLLIFIKNISCLLKPSERD